MRSIELRLAQYGISGEQIRAKAMHLCGSAVSMFNRMETNRETSLRMLRKENDRRPAVENAKVRDSDDPDGEVIG
jgi:hypothetical protein